MGRLFDHVVSPNPRCRNDAVGCELPGSGRMVGNTEVMAKILAFVQFLWVQLSPSTNRRSP